MTSRKRIDRRQLALFASLYAIQGVVVAYFFNYNQIYMESTGVGRGDAAGLQSVALLPFVLKFLAGPVSDRIALFGLGHRKPYIMLGLLLQSLGLAGLTVVGPSRQFHLFGLAAVITVVGMALYDTCCDGMVLDVTPAADRARVQATLVASRFLAAMVCSIWFGLWLEGAEAGPSRFHAVIWMCVLLGLVPLVQAALLPEPRQSCEAAKDFQWSALGVLVLPRSLVVLAYGILYSVVGYGVEINLSPYYKSLHFRDADVGTFAALRYLGRAAGAAMMPVMMRQRGRRATLALGIAALAGATAVQAAIGGRLSAAAAALAFGAANGWNDAVFCVLAMESCDSRMAASTYSLFMAATNVSVAGGWVVARLETELGNSFPRAVLASSALSLAALVFVPALSRPVVAQDSGDGDA